MGTALLGEADFLTGQVLCPQTPPDAIASFTGIVPSPDEWVIDGVCAYVPQVGIAFQSLIRWSYTHYSSQSAWLRNASIKGDQQIPVTLLSTQRTNHRRHRKYLVQPSLRRGALPENSRGVRPRE